jgi:hypothetical protein
VACVLPDVDGVRLALTGLNTAAGESHLHVISSGMREYALNSVAELARRARDAGHLRPGFVLDDLILMLMANDGIHATSPATRVAASRRFAALAIQAFQARGGEPDDLACAGRGPYGCRVRSLRLPSAAVYLIETGR